MSLVKPIRRQHVAMLAVFAATMFSRTHAFDGAQPDNQPTPDSSATAMTLEELKAAGAQRSIYRNATPPITNTTTPKANLQDFVQKIKPVLTNSCVPCHGEDLTEGNMRIDTLNPDLLHGEDVDWWLEVLAVVSNEEMPPPEDSDLSPQDRSLIVEWLSNELQVASTFRRAEGGHSSFRRMTRYEYNYALQDLLGLPWQFAKDLPPEANSEDGFQNSSEMLHMSVTQVETYRQLARKALQRATVIGEQPAAIHWGVTMKEAAAREWPKQKKEIEKLTEKHKDDPEKQAQAIERLKESFRKPHRNAYYRDLTSGRTAKADWKYYNASYAFAPTDAPREIPAAFDHVAIIPQGTNHRLTVELGNRVPDDGVMRVRARAARTSTDAGKIPSLQLEFGWQASNEGRSVIRVSTTDTPIHATQDAPEFYEWEFPLGDIYPRNSVRTTSEMGRTPSPSEYIRFVNSSVSQGDIQIDYVEVMTPVYEQWPPLSHQRIFFDSPHKNEEEVYAEAVVAAFMKRAWRRDVTDEEVGRKLKLFHAVRSSSDTFEQAVVEVLATVLSSPNLIYISQSRTLAAKPEAQHNQLLSQNELASRLSMFLWGSVPDEELLNLASQKQLASPDVVVQQIDRMLNDDRAKRFSKHFVRQWLDMQLLDFLNVKGRFDPLVKEAMQHEPVAVFNEMLHTNASVLDFIHADYTLVNERLAKHYGLPGVKGNEFRRVSLQPNQHRGGLLTQAGLLAMNSAGKDSHPLKRGIWLLECILNDPPPPPPPAVPEIDLADPEIAKMTLKERIEDHRNHAACMSCHAKIDPWGIAFENYDANGRWRTKIKDKPVDASSLLFNSQPLAGMDGLKRFLLENRQDQFVRAMVHKLTTYALGRPLTFSDRSSVEKITAETRQQGDGLTTMIKTIVLSDLFRSK